MGQKHIRREMAFNEEKGADTLPVKEAIVPPKAPPAPPKKPSPPPAPPQKKDPVPPAPKVEPTKVEQPEQNALKELPEKQAEAAPKADPQPSGD